MKQVQFAHYKISALANLNAAVRAQMEDVMSNGWELDSWNVVGYTVDESNQPVVGIVVCMTRELAETKKASKKEDA